MMPFFFVVMLVMPTFGGPVKISTGAVSMEACQEYRFTAEYSLKYHHRVISECSGGEAEKVLEAARLVVEGLDKAGRRFVTTVELVSPEDCERAKRVAKRLVDGASVSECEAMR